jgi:NAD(P)-dependent dehydrogenase (short-subunit alcohol dehydrogenase family)
MQDRLNNQAILVIGAATGIGAATAERLCAEGARVCVADLDFAGAQQVAKRLQDAGSTAFAAQVDIADEASVNAMMGEAVARLGGLDGCHVNAADMGAIFMDSDALEVDLAIFDRLIAVNLRGHLLCTRAALPHLLASERGAIVYTSSAASVAGEPERPSYAAAKAGVNALMRHVASKWGKRGLTANCVAPGFVMTPEMIAAGTVPPQFIEQCLAQVRSPRLGAVEDIAAMVAMLLSQDGRWINGQVLHVNGGTLLN